ncbi:MAG: hypothetical protein H5U40_06875 [Polyangiaceae bacterium]|nr:hypothetical protein [Polyangiaceae bacterium]
MKLEELPCKLDNVEVRLKGEELARVERKYGEVEEEKKTVTKEFGDKLKSLRGTMDKLAKEIDSRTEYRNVEVVDREDLLNQMVVTVRTDTGETVRSRAMNLSERQTRMFGAGSRLEDDVEDEAESH